MHREVLWPTFHLVFPVDRLKGLVVANSRLCRRNLTPVQAEVTSARLIDTEEISASVGYNQVVGLRSERNGMGITAGSYFR